MAHASPGSALIRNRDDVPTISRNTPDKQAATRAAYIARVVSEAPPLRDEQIDLLAVMFRPAIRQNATPFVSVANYQRLEIQRFIDSETPGKFGTFSANDVAA